MSDVVLELSGITQTFHQGGKALEVLKGIDLKLNAGEMIALVGPSGSGKSTLLQIAGLLEKAEAGEVAILGEATNGAGDGRRTELRRRHLGFVYQYHHLLAEFSARENIVMPQMIAGRSKKEARARADELLGDMGLAGRADHRPARLSGGEQQRVAIARALANSPALLLADEPTGNLDPDTANGVFDLLVERVRGAGMAALIATHNTEIAARLDRRVSLENGKLVEH